MTERGRRSPSLAGGQQRREKNDYVEQPGFFENDGLKRRKVPE
jgi:hypothetical protein